MASQFNPLTACATDLQCLLRNGEITSVGIVEAYLRQVDEHESTLHSFIAIAPRDGLLQAAAALDEERRRGHLRSSLHGIPIVLKVPILDVVASWIRRCADPCQDNFITSSDLGMGTTAGSWALVGAKATKNSAVAQKLIDAGLLILGKTNMTVRCKPAALRQGAD
jgi:amidase